MGIGTGDGDLLVDAIRFRLFFFSPFFLEMSVSWWTCEGLKVEPGRRL